jgi:hypothetical protein
MLRIHLLVLTLVCAQFSMAQEVFQKGNYFGLKYDGAEWYAAVFDEIEIHDYFVAGRMGTLYYNLSKNKKNIDKAYRKFNYSLTDRLLVIGETTKGTIDILDETGQNYYLKDGPYRKVLSKKKQRFYGNDDLLIVKKNSKQGIYNWVEKTELLPPVYSKIIIHETCDFGGVFIYAQDGLTHTIFDEKGNQVLSFKATMVSDIYPSNICDGYIIQWEHKVGFCKRMKNGKFFLIKPLYDDIYFPNGDASVIVVENRERKGLFVNYRQFLKCRYDEIEISENNYYLAVVTRKGVKKILKNNGELTLFTE